MGITDLANRCVDELSGGQRQRVWLLWHLLNKIDILRWANYISWYSLSSRNSRFINDLNRRRNTTIVTVLHDINLSARYADYICLRKGKLIKQGLLMKL